MREIKFRVWDKNKNKMNYDITGFECSQNIIDGVFIDGEYFNLKNGVLMQYTGLKDKNGMEIYEGDKVKIIRYDYENGSENSWGDLIPEEVETIITMSFEFAYTFNIMGEFDEESMEVVGNIYEDLKESGE